jgi:hypothetical protein
MVLSAPPSGLHLALWIVGGTFASVVVLTLVVWVLLKGGRRLPIAGRIVDRATQRMVQSVTKPLTVAVLDEVAGVLRTGHYTRNVALALRENRKEIKHMVAEKIKTDRTAGAINLVPFHDRLIEQASETTMRVILEVLADPRTDELVSDMLRENVDQIRAAVTSEQE